MIMETNSSIPISAQMHLAALSGNNAFDYYDFSGLYEVNTVKPRVSHIEDIRLVNKILGNDLTDIALNGHGYGLYVHNWEGVNSAASTSPQGITFLPDYPTSQAVSIIRSDTEIVLMTTKGGRFTLSDSIEVNGVSKGYFNGNNEWVNQGEIPLRNTSRGNMTISQRGLSLSVDAGTTLRLARPATGEAKPRIFQAEFAKLGGGAPVEADIEAIGFAGNGYVRFPSTGGAYINWYNVDGLTGGSRTIKIRYSHGGTKPSKMILCINNKEQFIYLQPTGSWEAYKYFIITVSLNSGANNTIRLETADNTVRIDRVVYHEGGGNIDELQIL